jgi:6-pyruvoyltetrahydropterin/6-carboxytetrahydropterin synthase
MISIKREHEFSYGHVVTGHECKCKHLHGHNGKVIFHCVGDLDAIGRVLDFSAVKDRLCMWLENNWDHRFLVWDGDGLFRELFEVLGSSPYGEPCGIIGDSLVFLPFNPTAENMADYLLHTIGPLQLKGTGVTLVKVEFYETSKCSAVAVLDTMGDE